MRHREEFKSIFAAVKHNTALRLHRDIYEVSKVMDIWLELGSGLERVNRSLN